MYAGISYSCGFEISAYSRMTLLRVDSLLIK